MKVTLTTAEHERGVAYLKSRFWTDGWKIRDEQIDDLVGVLPTTGGPDASVVTGTEAAFVLENTLMVATWDAKYQHLTTKLLALPGLPLTIEWNAEWLSQFDTDESEEVPEDRPMTVTIQAPNGEAFVLPFDEAWYNPVGCVNFVSTVMQRTHGFRPGIGTGQQSTDSRTWKR